MTPPVGGIEAQGTDGAAVSSMHERLEQWRKNRAQMKQEQTTRKKSILVSAKRLSEYNRPSTREVDDNRGLDSSSTMDAHRGKRSSWSSAQGIPSSLHSPSRSRVGDENNPPNLPSTGFPGLRRVSGLPTARRTKTAQNPRTETETGAKGPSSTSSHRHATEEEVQWKEKYLSAESLKRGLEEELFTKENLASQLECKIQLLEAQLASRDANEKPHSQARDDSETLERTNNQVAEQLHLDIQAVKNSSALCLQRMDAIMSENRQLWNNQFDVLASIKLAVSSPKPDQTLHTVSVQTSPMKDSPTQKVVERMDAWTMQTPPRHGSTKPETVDAATSPFQDFASYDIAMSRHLALQEELEVYKVRCEKDSVVIQEMREELSISKLEKQRIEKEIERLSTGSQEVETLRAALRELSVMQTAAATTIEMLEGELEASRNIIKSHSEAQRHTESLSDEYVPKKDHELLQQEVMSVREALKEKDFEASANAFDAEIKNQRIAELIAVHKSDINELQEKHRAEIIKCKTEAATFQKQMNAKVQALTLQMTEGLQKSIAKIKKLELEVQQERAARQLLEDQASRAALALNETMEDDEYQSASEQ